ncbi:EAL domain-containing protein, partial [Streptomyces ipomoeae]
SGDVRTGGEVRASAATGVTAGAGVTADAEGDDNGQPSPADEIIVEALVQLAHRLGLTVTAEGVETDAQASRLRRLGCDTGQGWLYSRAVSPERIAELLGTAACPQA